ncbi:MAG: PorP/SprF family type IX secretion system membrane protein [Flavobacteriales bacterium]
MKFIKYTLVIAFFAAVFNTSAQQDPMFSQYMFNTLAINPAYAGSADLLTANIIYRHQWADIDGAPRTQTVTLHSPLKKESVSLGGSIINDAHGPVKQTGVYLDASYRITMDRSRLSFGLKGGMNFFSANLTDLSPVVEDDPVFSQNISTKLLPNFGAGIMWYSNKSYLGLSVPKLLQNRLIDGDLPNFTNNAETMHYFFTAGTVLEVNNYTYFKPALLVKAVDGAPLSFDVTANFMFYEKFWIGAMYRYQDAIGMLLQYEINNKVHVGYAYDYSITEISNYTTGSHEIMLGVDFGKRFGGDVSPRFF